MADDSSFSSAQTLRSAEDLATAGLIAPVAVVGVAAVSRRYAIAITPHLAGLIERGEPDDPIARQFVPDPRELTAAPGELADPIGDEAHSPVEGIVHRYPDRVLLKLLSVCPVYCRFCFRRETVGPGENQMLLPGALGRAFEYIANTPAIWEVILTGGDPLMLSARRLGDVLARLGEIGHVKTIRIHTRVPVADPGRIDALLVQTLRAARQPVYVAVHSNHPREFTPETRHACALLADAGIPLVSQSVLLRGVNDNAETLAQLMRLFVENRIKPYYLHHADMAPGTSHFRTTIAEGQALMRALRGRLSGLAMPQYVLDIPGGHGKSPVGPVYAEMQAGTGQAKIRDWQGGAHNYEDQSDGG